MKGKKRKRSRERDLNSEKNIESDGEKELEY